MKDNKPITAPLKYRESVNAALNPHISDQGVHEIISQYAFTTFRSLISPNENSTQAFQMFQIMERCQLTDLDHINAKDIAGLTPLHWAALLGFYEAASMLIENHAIINPSSNKSDTPLDWAIENNHSKIANLLRDNGGLEYGKAVETFISVRFKSRIRAKNSFWHDRSPCTITLNEILQHAKGQHNINGMAYTGDKTRKILEKSLAIKISDSTTEQDLRDAIVSKANNVTEPNSCTIM